MHMNPLGWRAGEPNEWARHHPYLISNALHEPTSVDASNCVVSTTMSLLLRSLLVGSICLELLRSCQPQGKQQRPVTAGNHEQYIHTHNCVTQAELSL